MYNQTSENSTQSKSIVQYICTIKPLHTLDNQRVVYNMYVQSNLCTL